MSDDTTSDSDAPAYKPWVRYLWWPLIVLNAVATVACLVFGIVRLAEGNIAPALFALLFTAVFGLRLVNEWPKRHAVTAGAG